MVASRDGVVLTDLIRVIDREPTLERVVVGERQPVEQRDPRLAFDSVAASKLGLSNWLKSPWRNAHRGEGADEHDIISREEPNGRSSVGQHGLDLLAREFSQERVVLDLSDLRAIQDSPGAGSDDFLDVRLGSRTLGGITPVPELDFDEDGAY